MKELNDFLFDWGNVIRHAASWHEWFGHARLVRSMQRVELRSVDRQVLASWVVVNLSQKLNDLRQR